ncbi:MAG: enoyl-CoA hydratase-related protein, partial [Planctomycetota bacterium]|nr:enoyl-CoA hydratase-related protein [Planctomycetota bacterium]
MPATATEYETITLETADHICTITLARPDVLNAFNDQLTFELQDALKQAERDDDVRVIVITGQGKAFCSGQDLGELKERYVPGYVPQLGPDLRKRYNPIIKRIREMDKPVIAAINGVA